MTLTIEQRQAQIDKIIPNIQHATAGGSDFRIENNELLILLSGSKGRELNSLSAYLKDLFMRSYRINCRIELTESAAFRMTAGKETAGQSQSVKELGHEGYSLNVNTGGIDLQANSVDGLRWGAVTLFFLVANVDTELCIAGCEINDYPRYQWRGFMLDKGRAPNSVNKIKWIIDFCALHKLNRLLFREGDDELNGVRYDTLPLGTENPYALNMAEISELIEYGNQRGVTIVPEIECLGHSQAKSLHYPHLVSGGFQQAYRDIAVHTRKSHLEPCNPESFDLLAKMAREWLSRTTTGELHIGMDEVRLPSDIQAEHMAGLLPELKKVADELGKEFKPIVWADAPATPDGWTDSVIRCPWAYAEHNNMGGKQMTKQGVDDLLKEDCREQVIMAGGSGSYHRPYAKNGVEVAVRNLLDWAQRGNSHPNFIGLLAVQWCGNCLEQWQQDFIAVADFSWKPPVNREFDLTNFEYLTAKQIDFIESFYPKPHEEADRSCWNGIWVKHGRYEEDLVAVCK